MQRQPTNKSSSEKEVLFNKIYFFAKEQNKAALIKMINEGIKLDIRLGLHTPCTLLAADAEHEAVDFLINNEEFKITKHAALGGYALCGNKDKVEYFISQGGYLEVAVWGYITGGHLPEAENLLSRGADIGHAIIVYALEGRVDKVGDLLNQLNQNQKINDRQLINVATGYYRGHHFKNRDKVLHILSFIDSDDIREKLFDISNELCWYEYRDSFLGKQGLLKEAAKINKIMKTYHLNYDEAQGYRVKGARTWLLQAPQLVSNETFVDDIFMNISSHLLGLSPYNTNRVFHAIHENLFQQKVENFTTGFFGFFKTEKQIEEFKKTAREQYHKRISFTS